MKQQINRCIALVLTACISFATLWAQKDTIHYQLGLSTVASGGDYAPFWIQSNRYGTISAEALSTTMQVAVEKDYQSRQKLFDYGFKVNAIGRVDKNGASVYLHEYYAKARLLCFSAVAGAREEYYGMQDSTLSSGYLLFSRNARPMPQLFAGIERYTAIPFTFGLIEIKGGLSNGWYTDNIYTKNGMMHHKFVYFRGGGKLPFHVQYGFEDVAQWGGTVPGWGKLPSSFSDFITVFKGNGGGVEGEAINALGNHIISQNLCVDATIADFTVSAYWQSLNEDGPIKLIGMTMNAKDGLWGISIRNKRLPFVKGFVYEFLNTTDQSGPYHDKDGMLFGGADSYFQNYVYANGWNHYLRTIGTPLISSPVYNKDGSVSIKNNRVMAHHLGIEGDIAGYGYRGMTTVSKNFGSYGVPMTPVYNTSVLLEVNKQLPRCHNIEVAGSFGADFGKLYGNNIGLMITLRKRGNLLSY